jgi:hypothetical protein
MLIGAHWLSTARPRFASADRSFACDSFAAALAWPQRKFRKATGDAPSLSSLPRASIGVGVCFGAVSCIAGLAGARLRTVRSKDRPSGTPLLSFHSLQRLRVTPRCLALPRAVAVPLRRFDRVAVHAVFRIASAPRIRLRSRSLAAQPGDFNTIRRAALRGSCIAAFLDLAMLRYPRIVGLVTGSVSSRRIGATAT